MRTIISLLLLLFFFSLFSQTQISQDNFEGNSSIPSWFGDDCIIDTNFNNPFPNGSNPSTKVLRYSDVGGLYANVGFDAGFNFNLLTPNKERSQSTGFAWSLPDGYQGRDDPRLYQSPTTYINKTIVPSPTLSYVNTNIYGDVGFDNVGLGTIVLY